MPLQALIDHLCTADPLTPAVERKARLLLLDTLACIAAGLQAPEVARIAQSFALLAPGGFRWPGSDASMSASDAAFVGGIAACWDEACEGLARSHGRPGIPAIASALPLAAARGETQGASFATLLRAIVTGYETGGRLGEVMRIRPGMHVDATWSCMDAAATAARLIGLDAAGTLAAIDLAACQMPASLYLPVRQGMTGRNTYLGHGARVGIDCALAVAAGIGSPKDAIESAWQVALGGTGDFPPLAPASISLVEEGYFKPYAAVRHVHYGARAALELRPALKDRLPSIDAMRLDIYGEAITYCGNRAPRTPIQAQFSLSYGLAAALVLGDLGPEAYRHIEDPLIRALEAKIEIVENAERTKALRRGARLDIRVAGETLSATVEAVEGDPGLPMSEASVCRKFLAYTTNALGKESAERLMRAVLDAPLDSPARAILG